jgi:hypothetical protein
MARPMAAVRAGLGFDATADVETDAATDVLPDGRCLPAVTPCRLGNVGSMTSSRGWRGALEQQVTKEALCEPFDFRFLRWQRRYWRLR